MEQGILMKSSFNCVDHRSMMLNEIVMRSSVAVLITSDMAERGGPTKLAL